MQIRIGLVVVLALLSAGCSAPADHGPRITATPDGASIARAVHVTAEGLTPGEPARLWARTLDRLGQQWQSSGEFTADDEGRVDVATAASTGGTYEGADPRGLFWSMRLPEERTPPFPLVGADDVVVELGVEQAGETVARTTLRRIVRAPQARSIPVAEAGLVGDLHLPAGPGPWPGVLLLGGSEGGRPDPAYAALLADHGYAVLGLAYFGEPGLPPTLSRIPVEYGLAGARWLAERPEVAGQQVGVIGTSKGAEYALLLASSEPDRFAAVVAHAPSDVVWPALGSDPDSPPVSSWTRGGVDVPYLPWAPDFGQDATPVSEPGQPHRSTRAFTEAVAGATPEELAAAHIPVEQITAPVLLTSGGDDGIWPSSPQAQRVRDAIDEADGPYDAQHLDFPEAGHIVGGVPGLPTTRTDITVGPVTLEAGGDPAAGAEAVRRTFLATLDLLRPALSS